MFLVPQIQTDETIGLCNLPFRTDLFANIQCPRGLKASTDFFFFFLATNGILYRYTVLWVTNWLNC